MYCGLYTILLYTGLYDIDLEQTKRRTTEGIERNALMSVVLVLDSALQTLQVRAQPAKAEMLEPSASKTNKQTKKQQTVAIEEHKQAEHKAGLNKTQNSKSHRSNYNDETQSDNVTHKWKHKQEHTCTDRRTRTNRQTHSH